MSPVEEQGEGVGAGILLNEVDYSDEPGPVDVVWNISDVGRVLRKGHPYGTCVRKLHYSLSGERKEVPDVVRHINHAGFNEGLVLDIHSHYPRNFAPVKKNGVWFRSQVEITGGYEKEYVLWQIVWGQLGSDIASDEHLNYTRFFANFSWYPACNLWLVHGEVVKEISWKIFNIEGGYATIKLSVDSNGMITANGTPTNMSMKDVVDGMAPVIELLKGVDQRSVVTTPLPPRDFKLLRTKADMAHLMENTVSSTTRRSDAPRVLPRDFTIPYVPRSLFQQHLRGHDVIDNFGRFGDHECRTCPYQMHCYSLPQRFPSASRRKHHTMASLRVMKQRMFDAPRPTLLNRGLGSDTIAPEKQDRAEGDGSRT